MIIKPLIKINVDPATREERLKALLEGSVLPLGDSDVPPGTGKILAKNDGFFFEGLTVGGKRYDLLFQNDELGSGTADQDTHWMYVKSQKDIVMPSGLVLYAMDHLAYSLRKDSVTKQAVEQFRTFHLKDWQTTWKHTGTRFEYQQGAEDATIKHMGLDGKIASASVKIPSFERYNDDWSYLVLADEQPESQLGTARPIPKTAQPFLEKLLGSTYADAGAVYQFMSSRKDNGNLREVRAWMPSLANRASPRALVLGVDDNDRFDISANDDVISSNGPARGVAVRKKYST